MKSSPDLSDLKSTLSKIDKLVSKKPKADTPARVKVAVPSVVQPVQLTTPQPNPVGRPLIFKTVVELDKAIDNYFDSCIENERPMTITGLALALKTTRKTLIDYGDRPEFCDSIERARLMCENYLEEGLLSDTIPATAGNFNLKNNYGWVDKTETENTNKNVNVVEAIRLIQQENARDRAITSSEEK